MLTDAQFYLRVLEVALSSRHGGGIPCGDTLIEEDDLREYMEAKFKIKSEDEDGGESLDVAGDQIHLTLQGFVQALGRKAGIDLKFIPEE